MSLLSTFADTMPKSLLTLCIITVLSNLPANAEWVLAQEGTLPPNGFIGGENSNGQPLYICRAKYADGVYPGMIGPSETCDITHQGERYSFPKYEVLVDSGYSWVDVFNGEIPFDAFPAGKTAQEDVLYICRADVDSHKYTGIISSAFSGCSILYEEKEKKVYWYEVLVGN